jgi:hypothetical protein
VLDPALSSPGSGGSAEGEGGNIPGPELAVIGRDHGYGYPT